MNPLFQNMSSFFQNMTSTNDSVNPFFEKVTLTFVAFTQWILELTCSTFQSLLTLPC